MSQFKACGKNNIEFVPHHGVWRNNRQMVLDIDAYDAYKSMTYLAYHEFKDSVRNFECHTWWTGKAFGIFTSDARLLDAVLVDKLLMNAVRRIRYTSAQYEAETRKMDSIATDIKLLQNKRPGRDYEIQLSLTSKHPKEHIKSLYAIIDANRTHVEITEKLENRLMEGRVSWNSRVFYCNNPEVIMMMRIGAPGVIHSVLKIVEKNSNED